MHIKERERGNCGGYSQKSWSIELINELTNMYITQVYQGSGLDSVWICVDDYYNIIMTTTNKSVMILPTVQ